jgi:7,8-dihydropterin-6-yl-methyl-4-(beta-D-ribofuranosyl)aminobenzene 5'-phosphate synthase
MTVFSPSLFCSAALLLLVGSAITTSATPMASADPSKAQITILYDAFGKDSAMQKDWGYAALVEYGGKRILFDAGNSPEVLAQNAKAKSIDLSSLDFVVMSHRHGDHMGGLAYLLKVNPKVKIYAPKEGFGVYGADLPSSFFAKTLLYRRNSVTTAVRPPTLCGLDQRGPAQTSNSWIKRSRSLPTSI